MTQRSSELHCRHPNPVKASATSDTKQLLTFLIDGEEYGVDIVRVQEIRCWSRPMPVPNAPAFIRGVINIRGDVVAIADLRQRLHLPVRECGPTAAIVVLRVNLGEQERSMGAVVDAMSDVKNVPASAIKPPPTFRHGAEAGLARGIVTLETSMITILDVDRMFDASSYHSTTTA